MLMYVDDMFKNVLRVANYCNHELGDLNGLITTSTSNVSIICCKNVIKANFLFLFFLLSIALTSTLPCDRCTAHHYQLRSNFAKLLHPHKRLVLELTYNSVHLDDLSDPSFK